MELLFSALTLLASALVAQILIDRNEIKRLEGYGEIPGTKTAKAGAAPEIQNQKAPQSVKTPGRIVPLVRPPVIKPTRPKPREEITLPDLPPVLLRRL